MRMRIRDHFYFWSSAMMALSCYACALLQLLPSVKAVELTPDVAAKLQLIAFQAAREGDVVTLKEYFTAGQPVNGLNARGDTLLTVAAYGGQTDAVNLILKQPKCEVDIKNKMGLTALAAAAFKGHVEIAELLVKAKADVNAQNGSKQTALMFAALTGRTKMVEFLLEAGADAAIVDKSGNTALSLAKTQGATDAVKLLAK